MMKCVIGSFLPLFWAFILIVSLSLLCAIVLVQSMTTFLVESKISSDEAVEIKSSFGSVAQASFTLFHTISGGDWMVAYNTVAKTGAVNKFVFLLYFVFIWLSVTNIITCIFVDKAMKLAQPDTDQQLWDKRKENLELAEEIGKVYEEIVGGVEPGHLLSWAEFEFAMQDPRISSHLDIAGLDVHNTFMFFSMLSSVAGKDEIDADTFIQSCLKMKGYAMNIDLLQVGYEIKILSKYQQKIFLQLQHDVACFRKDLSLLKPQLGTHGSCPT